MNKNMNWYVDMLEVHTFQLEYEYENSKEGGGKKKKGGKKRGDKYSKFGAL